MSKDNNWIYKSLDVGLSVNGNGDSEVVVKDNESGFQANLVFSKDTYTEEEIAQQIGDEIYSWLLLMKDQLNDEEEAK